MTKPKVLISDKMDPNAAKIFEERGCQVDVITGETPEQLIARIGEYDGLAIRSATKVTPKILQNARSLKVIGRAGIGVDNVDIPAATAAPLAVTKRAVEIPLVLQVNPDPRNLMSYSNKNCRDLITAGQGSKALQVLRDTANRRNLIINGARYVDPLASVNNGDCSYNYPCHSVAKAMRSPLTWRVCGHARGTGGEGVKRLSGPAITRSARPRSSMDRASGPMVFRWRSAWYVAYPGQ